MRAEQRQRKITSTRLIAHSHMSKHQAQGLTCALSCTPGVGGNNLHVSRADPNAASSLLASQQGLIAFTCKPFPALLIYYLGAFLVPEVKVKKKKKKMLGLDLSPPAQGPGPHAASWGRCCPALINHCPGCRGTRLSLDRKE